jgi:hypothetical protein
VEDEKRGKEEGEEGFGVEFVLEIGHLYTVAFRSWFS